MTIAFIEVLLELAVKPFPRLRSVRHTTLCTTLYRQFRTICSIKDPPHSSPGGVLGPPGEPTGARPINSLEPELRLPPQTERPTYLR